MGAEDRGAMRPNWIGNLMLAIVAVKLAVFVARKIVGRRDKWSTEMLPELLRSIPDYMPLSFRTLCNGWCLAPFWRPGMENFPHDRPLLLFYGLDDKDKDDDTCYLYSKSHWKCSTVELAGLRGATCVDSKYGWILARRGRQFFFYNPFSKEKVELATEYPHSDAAEQVYTFEFCPPSPYSTALVVSRRKQSTVEISSCRVGDAEWRTEEIDVGGLELGTLGFVDTTYADDGCISIHTENSVLRYNTTTKTWSLKTTTTTTTKDALFSDIRAVHQKDWLFRFGKRGISVAMCSLHMKLSNSDGLVPCTSVVASGIRGAVVLENVKAVWIQPPGYKRPTEPIKLSRFYYLWFFTRIMLHLGFTIFLMIFFTGATLRWILSQGKTIEFSIS